MVLSLVFVRSYNFGWSPVYDCKAYLETNTVKNCSYFGFGGYFLVSGTGVLNQVEQHLLSLAVFACAKAFLAPVYTSLTFAR